MSTDVKAYQRALHPFEHLSDEDISDQLDRIAKRSKAARKAHERARQKQAEQQAQQDKRGVA